LDIFGGTTNEQGYKVLDSHIGAIYGDSITPERAIQIAERLKAKGFANQVVLGIGSYSMGYATRDSQGGAVKSTYVEINGKQRPIFKDPVTDDGTKKSAKGLLQINENLELINNCSWEEEEKGLLKIIYKDGVFRNLTTLIQIRNKLNNSLTKENLSLTKEN
jgi:nicotinamide phosphoribosyltransferase